MLESLWDLWIHFMVVVFGCFVFCLVFFFPQTSCSAFELVNLVAPNSLTHLHSPPNFLTVLFENLKDYGMHWLSWS